MSYPLYVAFTMDCERAQTESPLGGPESWEASEAAIRGFSEKLLEHGIPPTLFLTPECAQAHRTWLAELEKRGAELGMHLHPQSLGDGRLAGCLGDYPGKTQKRILQDGVSITAEALGRPPESFRPGNFSASDETYAVLVDLGFLQGSVSDPGRESPQYAAVWTGADPDPHWAHPSNRLASGDLPFLEVPVTTNPHQLRPNGFPHELRIEHGSFEEHHLPILQYALERMESRSVDFRCLCIFTHNTFPYEDENSSVSTTLTDFMSHISNLGNTNDIRPVTLKEMQRYYAGGDG